MYFARSKHIDIKYKFLKEKLAMGELELNTNNYLPTEKLPTDILTKVVSANKIQTHLPTFGLNNIIIET